MAAMVLLTFVVLGTLFRTRIRAVREGTVRASYFQTYQGDAEPEGSIQLSRHFVNLFEAPTLFYVVCLAALATDRSSTGLVVLAWGYVALRIVHTLIHTGSNQLPARIGAYFSSWAVLLSMWGWLVVAGRPGT